LTRLALLWLTTVAVLSLKLCSANFSPLCKRDKNWLVGKKLAVHFIDSACGFLWGGIAHETKSSRLAVLEILHDASRGDSSHLREFVTKNIISYRIVKILDV
jgi:hypothetical protein